MIPSKPQPLSAKQLECLRKFASLEISLDKVRRCLSGLVNFDFGKGGSRWMETRFQLPIPGIPITKQHIENALTKRRNGLISEQQLVEWATMILHNHAYELHEADEDLIAEWLNNISFDLHPYPK